MRALSELNINEGGEPVHRSAPSDAVIQEFQNHFEIILPEYYLKLLRHSNGGHPEFDTIAPVAMPGASPWAVNRFYYLDDDKTSGESLWANMEPWQRILGGKAVPFAEDGGGNQFFLDLNTVPASVKVCVCTMTTFSL